MYIYVIDLQSVELYLLYQQVHANYEFPDKVSIPSREYLRDYYNKLLDELIDSKVLLDSIQYLLLY